MKDCFKPKTLVLLIFFDDVYLFLMICVSLSSSSLVMQVSFRNWGLSVLSNQHSLHSDLISWRSSTLGTFMLNFDGMVSLIMQLQDTSLEIMMVPYWPAAGGKQLFSYLVSYAEMIGVWLGLQYLLSHTTVRKVCIQGDSMVALSWLHHLSLR